MDTDTAIKDVRPDVQLVAFVTQEGWEEIMNTHGFKPFGESPMFFEKVMDVVYSEAVDYAKSLKGVAGVKFVSVTIVGEGIPAMPDPPYTGQG